MRKIMLVMSVICLTAFAAGCEENGMLVLMGEGTGEAAGTPNDPTVSTPPETPSNPEQPENDKPKPDQPGTDPGTPEPEKPVIGGVGDNCDKDSECREGLMCRDGRCEENGDDVVGGCPEGQIYNETKKSCVSDPTTGAPPSFEQCQPDGSCEGGKVCVNGKCLNECRENDNCNELSCGCRGDKKCQSDGSCEKESINQPERCSNEHKNEYRCKGREIQKCINNKWEIIEDKCTDNGYHYCGNENYEFNKCENNEYCLIYSNGDADCVDTVEEGSRCFLKNNTRCSKNGKNIFVCEGDDWNMTWKKQDQCSKEEICYMYFLSIGVYESYCK